MKLKGKFTKLNAGLFALVQMPNLLAEVSTTTADFARGAEAFTGWSSLVFATGIAYGAFRTFSKKYKDS